MPAAQSALSGLALRSSGKLSKPPFSVSITFSDGPKSAKAGAPAAAEEYETQQKRKKGGPEGKDKADGDRGKGEGKSEDGAPSKRQKVSAADTASTRRHHTPVLPKDHIDKANESFPIKKRARDWKNAAYGTLVQSDFWNIRWALDEAWARHELQGESGAFVKYNGKFEDDMPRNCPAGRICPGKCTDTQCQRVKTHSGAVLLPLETRVKIHRMADKIAQKAGVKSLKTDLAEAKETTTE